jgi:hypothetical protein
MPGEQHWIVQVWAWTKENDLPNWMAVFVSAILWPVALFVWNHRRVNNIAHLEVQFAPGQIEIGGKPHTAISIDFTNHTGSVVYLTGARIKRCSSLFRVPIDASRDIAESSYHMKFMDQLSGKFVHREQTLQTNQGAHTCMATTSDLPESFYTYTAPWWRRVFRVRKYFLLEYTAVVGTTRRSVRTLY